MMKSSYISGVLLPIALVIMVPAWASADVRIQLRNGSSVIADECQDQEDLYVCFKMGGTFEIEKNDILSIKNVKAGTRDIPVTSPQDKTSGSQPEQIKQAGSGEDAAKKSETGQTQGKTSDPAAPADPLVARALELQAERDLLIKERQRLQEEARNAPNLTWLQVDDLQRRIAALDEKIKKFNEEANRLMEEDKKRREPKKEP